MITIRVPSRLLLSGEAMPCRLSWSPRLCTLSHPCSEGWPPLSWICTVVLPTPGWHHSFGWTSGSCRHFYLVSPHLELSRGALVMVNGSLSGDVERHRWGGNAHSVYSHPCTLRKCLIYAGDQVFGLGISYCPLKAEWGAE